MNGDLELSDILRKEPFVLVDSNVNCIDRVARGEFFDKLRRALRFNQIDPLLFKEGEEATRDFLGFVSSKRVYTIKEVVEELMHFQKMCEDRLDIFDRYTRRDRGEKSRSNLESRARLVKICRKVERSICELKSSIYTPKNQSLYDCFKDCLVYLVEKLKIENTPNQNGVRYMETDEKIMAAAFHRSVFDEKGAAIVTHDKRFLKLLTYLTKVSSSGQKPHNRRIQERLRRTPVRLYMSSPAINKYNLRIMSSDVRLSGYNLGPCQSNLGYIRIKREVDYRLGKVI